MLARAARALAEFEVEGVATVVPFHRAVVADPDFAQDFKVHTRWIETEFRAELAGHARVTPAPEPGLWRGEIEIDGRRHRVALPLALFGAAPAPQSAATEPEAPGTVSAPVSGTLTRWLLPDGQEVAAGEAIAVMEAMKMETRIEAPSAGRLHHIVAEGTPLAFGAALAQINA